MICTVGTQMYSFFDPINKITAGHQNWQKINFYLVYWIFPYMPSFSSSTCSRDMETSPVIDAWLSDTCVVYTNSHLIILRWTFFFTETSACGLRNIPCKTHFKWKCEFSHLKTIKSKSLELLKTSQYNFS